MSPKIRGFRDLKIWVKGMEVVEEIYGSTCSFPEHEKFGLVSQMRRAAVSIPSNIAEGFVRRHNKEHRQFLCVALGSCAELETQIEIAVRLKYFDGNSAQNLLGNIDHLNRMTMNLIKCL